MTGRRCEVDAGGERNGHEERGIAGARNERRQRAALRAGASLLRRARKAQRRYAPGDIRVRTPLLPLWHGADERQRYVVIHNVAVICVYPRRVTVSTSVVTGMRSVQALQVRPVVSGCRDQRVNISAARI